MVSCRWGLWGANVLPFLCLLQISSLVAAQSPTGSTPWQTLNGSTPVVIARGGFSGMYPASSYLAYWLANQTSLRGTVQWCNVQLTKDRIGICLPDVNLGNCTDVDGRNLPSINTTIDGHPESGWFAADYTISQLLSFGLIQELPSRTQKYDGQFFILNVTLLPEMYLTRIWLNIEHTSFYDRHNLSMRDFLLSINKSMVIDYISSPEVVFLRNVSMTFNGTKTKFIFHFLEAGVLEPSTNKTYDSLLRNLTFIKTFASGILIPKSYIWPVNACLYLQQHSSIVSDAHKIGLEVFASDFSNDVLTAYNYSYNPLTEYLSFVDNGNFSVDGVLSDFPITASEAIGCFSHIKNENSVTEKPLIISHNGASVMFPGCTDLAYKQAVEDGTDFIDCPVQVTQDNVLICLSSINLMLSTTVANSTFQTRTSIVPSIQSGTGIFTFNLTWKDIQTLKPAISNPFLDPYYLLRNPENKNAGSFTTLSEFLAFAKGKPAVGALISIENAPFLEEKLGFNVTDSVIQVLEESGYKSDVPNPKLMIQSPNSSVLIALRNQTKYKLVYEITKSISDVDTPLINYITEFADSVAVTRPSIFPESVGFILNQTKLVEHLHSKNLSVYVYFLMNEYVTIPWDFFSDPILEVHNYVEGAKVDGVITDNPQTASSYRRNACLNGGDYNLTLVKPGSLLTYMNPQLLPPNISYPVLTDSDVVEPPLTVKPPSPDGSSPKETAPGPSSSLANSIRQQLSVLTSLLIYPAMLIGTTIFLVV